MTALAKLAGPPLPPLSAPTINAALKRAAASELVRGLKARGIAPALLEQWLGKDDLEGMRALGVESGWLVAADESVTTAEDAERLVRENRRL